MAVTNAQIRSFYKDCCRTGFNAIAWQTFLQTAYEEEGCDPTTLRARIREVTAKVLLAEQRLKHMHQCHAAQIPSASAFYLEHNEFAFPSEILQAFARLHVEAALKAAAHQARFDWDRHSERKQAILQCYPLTNIK